jgi:hypothetical protein
MLSTIYYNKHIETHNQNLNIIDYLQYKKSTFYYVKIAFGWHQYCVIR